MRFVSHLKFITGSEYDLTAIFFFALFVFICSYSYFIENKHVLSSLEWITRMQNKIGASTCDKKKFSNKN